MSARLAYGIGDTWGAEGVLTPYTDVSLSDAGARRLSLGGPLRHRALGPDEPRSRASPAGAGSCRARL